MPDYVGTIHVVLAAGLPMTIAETRAFTAQAKGLLDDDEIADLKVELSIAPFAGAVMEGTGGVRKHRIGFDGRGKRSGARVIYYFHDREMPIYLLAIYAKSEKIDLSDVEKAAMRKLVKELVRAYRANQKMIS